MSQRKILIYCDDGSANVDVAEASIKQAINELHLQNDFQIENVTANDIIGNENTLLSTKLFVMPGGRDLPYVEKLNGLGNRRIKHFVNQGGCYLGLCAGAYFASSIIEFEKDTALEVCGARELKFYHGLAKGCVYPGFSYKDNSGARVVPIELHKEVADQVSFNQCSVYYNGGCEFLPLNDDVGEVEILASYSAHDNENSSVNRHAPPIAIIKCKVGSGIAILSGVHPEYSANLLSSDKYDDKILQHLHQCEHNRAVLFRKLLSMLLL
ncbi:uncharacterized protein TRIADDRAFT_55000 [Trichoplax adhaerens]|uniref:Biotin-protein ligase N-terminal domain-containing protein n=1 Tax=Trichoplax adhaerens TaxID=10228 RepID=B3RQI3_TRIAD|nr:hypothetical protein TRIADDRAFT_55000 [Trichoplax adhaerens]EDV26702.1 hypothetical protein TRIADDRAFT_55000 [Trichoplax adhaerens]|eukprot:XP_002110698.1 hypothetical protein TRIADDRAFT_55000 [Trichoplax adhaerens]